MGEEKLSWAVIGVGKHAATRGGATAIAYAHAEGIRRNPQTCSLAAAAARTRSSLDDFAREYPCRTYTCFRELLAAEKPDACAVSTYAPDREEHVTAAIDAGVKVILVEKPLSLTMSAALRMKKAADAAGARLFVNYQRRYGFPFEKARETVLSGRLGRVLSIELMQPCANALDFGPHFINAALYLLGDETRPLRVLAAADALGENPWHSTAAERRFAAAYAMADGTKIFFTADPDGEWTAGAIRVTGEKGYLELWAEKAPGMAGSLRIVDGGGVEIPATDENFHHGDDDRFLYFARAYADIARAVADGGPTRLDFSHALATQRMLLGAYVSAQRSRTFVFAEEEPDPVFATP